MAEIPTQPNVRPGRSRWWRAVTFSATCTVAGIVLAGTTACAPGPIDESVKPPFASSPLWDALDSNATTRLTLDEQWLRLLPDALCPPTVASDVGKSVNPNPPLDCKVVEPTVLKAVRLPDGDVVALLRYGRSILPAPPKNAEERRASEEAASTNPRGSEKDKDGYFVVPKENLEFSILQVRPSADGLKLVDLVPTSDPSVVGDAPGA